MNPAIPPHIQKELAKRELAMLTKQRDVAAESIKELSDAVASMPVSSYGIDFESGVLHAIRALVSTRLLELQFSHDNLSTRVAELEKAIAMTESGILRPGGVLR